MNGCPEYVAFPNSDILQNNSVTQNGTSYVVVIVVGLITG
jgi:hypothetical protein